MRRRASGLPAGKTFDAWDRERLADPQGRPSRRCARWNGSTAPRTFASADRAGPARATSSRRSGTSRSTTARPSPGTRSRRLAVLLRRHRADDSVNKAIGRLIRADLIVIDDIGMLPVAPDAAEALFRVVDAAYEKRSIALTSNIHPAGFDELMPKTLADRDRRPAPAPRPRAAHRRHRQLPARPSDRRQGGDAPHLTAQRAIAAPPRPTGSAPRRQRAGENRWPPAGRKHVRQWGDSMAAAGEKPMAVDTGRPRHPRYWMRCGAFPRSAAARSRC